MSGPPQLSEALRRAVAADLRPVRALRPPARRVLDVALWAVVALVAAPLLFSVRPDATLLGVMVTFGAAALEVVAGLLLVGAALREAVPGGGIGRARAAAALTAGAAVQTAVALLTWMGARAAPAAAGSGHSGAACAAMQGMLGLPALAIALFLLARALPVRPPWAGALAGLGAGLIADGAWHTVCPMCGLEHLLVWHGGATVLMAGGGWLLGIAWQRREERRMMSRLGRNS
jgi:hypothetical protein